MKTKLLCLMAVLLALSFNASAVTTDVSGTYNGTMGVSVSAGAPTSEINSVVLTKEADGTYTLSIASMVYAGSSLGSATITQLIAVENAGVVTFSKAGVTSITVVYSTFPIPADVTFTSGNVTGDNLVFQLDILATLNMGMGNSYIPVVVNFDGNIPSGINDLNADEISLSQSADGASILVSGVEKADYTIYNSIGTSVEKGVLNGAEINVSDLSAGIYIISINGASSKFIKN